MNSTESTELVSLASRFSHLATGVNYNNRYYPLCIEAREAVAAGDLGRIFHVTGSVTQDWLLYETDYNWRVLREEQGALRALADIGAHWMDLMHYITGLEAEALCADFTTVHPLRQRPKGEVETFAGKGATAQETESIPIYTEDYGAVLLRFRGGARGCFYVSQISPGRKYRVAFEIAAQHRTLAWNSERCEEMWIGRRAEANRILMRDPSLLSHAASSVSDYPGGHNEGYPDTFKMCFRAFYRAIASGDLSAPSYPTFADGHLDILLCEAIQRSYQTGGWVSVEERTP
jgi:predicted dehydrogenase